MQFSNDAHRLAVKQAFLRITADQSWSVMRTLADEVIYKLEQKCIREDDEAKAAAYRHTAKAAHEFWEQWLHLIELTKGDQIVSDTFLEVVMD